MKKLTKQQFLDMKIGEVFYIDNYGDLTVNGHSESLVKLGHLNIELIPEKCRHERIAPMFGSAEYDTVCHDCGKCLTGYFHLKESENLEEGEE